MKNTLLSLALAALTAPAYAQTVAPAPRGRGPVNSALPFTLNSTLPGSSFQNPLALPAVNLKGSLPSLTETPAPIPSAEPATESASLPSLEAAAAQTQDKDASSSDPSGSYQKFFNLGRSLFDRARRADDTGGLVTPEALPSEQEMIERMRLSENTNDKREQAVIELLIRAGANYDPAKARVTKPDFSRHGEIQIQEAGEKGKHNIFVVLNGKSDALKIHGAHQDRVEEGFGTIDNWTGTTGIINAFQDILDRVRDGLKLQSTHVFALFAREEEGLVGSRHWLNSATRAEQKRMDAMQNADTLALGLVAVMRNISDQALTELVVRVAKRIGVAISVFDIWGGDSDSSTFRDKLIQAYTLIGGTAEKAFSVIHSERDNMEAFLLPSYVEAVRLLVAVALELDHTTMRPKTHFKATSRNPTRRHGNRF